MVKILKSISSRQSSGLSYVEIIVTVAIIGIVTVIAIANYVGGEQRKQVEYGARQLTQDIRKMQALSLAGKKDNNDANTPRPCGYGVYLNASTLPSSYTLFREDGSGACANIYVEEMNQEIERSPIQLPKDVVVGDIAIRGTGGYNKVSVLYDIPFAKVFVNGVALDVTDEVGIEVKIDTSVKNIVIKGNGEISAQ